MTERAAPTRADLVELAEILDKTSVRYALIGGMALALHGLFRGTKDIDLLLPVDKSNSDKLLAALKSFDKTKRAADNINSEDLGKGFSTAAEDKIALDLLFVAAGKTFEDLQGYLETINIDGVPVKALNIDGLLLTKQTNRLQDQADRLKLEAARKELKNLNRDKPKSF